MPLLPLLKMPRTNPKEDKDKTKKDKTSMKQDTSTKVIKVTKLKKKPATKNANKRAAAKKGKKGKKTTHRASATKGKKTRKQGKKMRKCAAARKGKNTGRKRTQDKKEKETQGKAKKVVAYARTSTKTNQGGNSAPRQLAACARVAQGAAMKKVSETISGMLPLSQRTRLQQLLSGEYDTVVVESARALSRSVETSEQIYNTARRNGVEIITSDLPGLFRVDGNPATNFMRRVMAATTEFDRDVLVLRLQAGLAAARKTTTRRTQTGKPKVQGRNSLMQHLKPTKQQIKKLRRSFQMHQNGDFGWRPLCAQVANILKLETQPAVETVRRMWAEIA